jgi:hypothetical protein
MRRCVASSLPSSRPPPLGGPLTWLARTGRTLCGGRAAGGVRAGHGRLLRKVVAARKAGPTSLRRSGRRHFLPFCGRSKESESNANCTNNMSRSRTWR